MALLIVLLSTLFLSAQEPPRNPGRLRATEDQAVAVVKLQQYENLPTYKEQRENMVRRMYREPTGKLL